MEYNGYMGKYLRVDLSTGKIEVHALEPDLMFAYLGGNGFGVRILFDEVGPDVDPLSADNRLIFASGPLGGTRWPASGRGEVIAKSPLTGIYGDANAGGMFPAFLKFSGYDMVIFQGIAPKPVYLHIANGEPRLVDASALWGLDTLETEAALKRQLGASTQVASIGPAGENLVRYACIMCSPRRSFARSGMGAVMGSKRLKAVAVSGNIRPRLAYPDEFMSYAKQMYARLLANQDRFALTQYGTPNLVPMMNLIGRFPTKNFQYGSFDRAEAIGPEALRRFLVQDMGCFNCPIRCDKLYRINQGEFKGVEVSSVEYETLNSLGSGVLVDDLPAVLKANDLCDRLGMDTISAGRTISFAMELYEKGIIDKRDTGGIELSWGDSRLVLDLLEMISRREGFGDLLAEGTRRMAAEISHGAAEYAMHVKGQEIPAQDGRAQQAMGLAHVTSTRGADHLKALPTVDETGLPGAAQRRYGAAWLPEVHDPHATKYKPFVVKDGEDFGVIIDSTGVCKLAGTLCFFEIYWDEMARGLTLATGIDFEVKTLKEIGARVYNLMRVYNVLHGITSKDDTLPARFLTEPSPSGGAKGHVCRLSEMLPEYYRLRGWDKKTGIPQRETLERLGLGDAVRSLNEAGIEV